MSCGVVDSFSLISVSPAVSSVIDIVSVWDESNERVSPSSLAGLELTTRTWLELREACLCLPKAGIRGVCSRAWL